jgi:hypothetical protein
MIYFFSYGNHKFEKSKVRILNQAKLSGFFDKCDVYGLEDIDESFKEKFNDIFKYERGGGYWIWKFYFIKKYLDEINDNDIIVYCDAGSTINIHGKKRYNEYIDIINKSDKGFLSFFLEYKETKWTIKELYEFFNINIDDPCINNLHYLSGLLILKKCDNVIKIIDDCLRAIRYDRYLITDNYNNNQSSGFTENRHDQSLLSLTRKIHGSINISGDEFETRNNIYPFWATRIRS